MIIKIIILTAKNITQISILINSFQKEELLKMHKNCYENSNYTDRTPPKKFNIKIHKKQVKEQKYQEIYKDMHLGLSIYINM